MFNLMISLESIIITQLNFTVEGLTAKCLEMLTIKIFSLYE